MKNEIDEWAMPIAQYPLSHNHYHHHHHHRRSRRRRHCRKFQNLHSFMVNVSGIHIYRDRKLVHRAIGYDGFGHNRSRSNGQHWQRRFAPVKENGKSMCARNQININ